jgi:tRNA(Ile)-lysidine synthase
MRKKVFETIEQHQLLSRGDRVIVGVSGGPDSLALLHILAHNRDLYDTEVIAVHMNHQFRGDESNQDEQVAAEYATKWGVSFYAKSVDVPSYIVESKLNPQVAARHVRYEYFREIAAKTGSNKIALAQHANDQAETILMRMVRGTGLEGLGGIPIRRKEGEWTVIRPFLELNKDEILEYCAAHNIDYRTDQSNLSRKYFRNQVRLDMIPFLEQYNPNIKQTLIHMSGWVRDENEYILKKAKEALGKVCSIIAEDEIFIDRSLFVPLEVALQRRVVKLILSCLFKSPMEIEGNLIEQVRELILMEQPSVNVHLKSGLWFHRTYDQIRIRRKPVESIDHSDFSYSLSIPGEIDVPEWGGLIRAVITTNPDDPWVEQGNNVALFDLDYFHSSLEVRNRRDGDRISPRGLNGTKKVKDMFINAKIPKYERHSIPLILYEGKVVWIAGLRASSYGAPTDKTSTFLLLEAKKRKTGRETQ